MQDSERFAVTEDALLGGRVRLAQPARGYRAAMDPVLLAATVAAKPGQTVLDLGCGVGAAALCLLARQEGVTVTGVEIQPDLAKLARYNARANGRDGSFLVIDGCVGELDRSLRFDHVMTNPPYVAAGRGTAPPQGGKALAHMEADLDLAAWIKAAGRHLAPKGSLTVIHRADRLGDLLAAMAGRGLGTVRIHPLWPHAGQPAGRVIVTARKGSRTPLSLCPGLVLHGADGRATPEAEACLRHAASLI